MSRLLALGLLLLPASAFAQAEPPGSGCRLLIAEEWVEVGATTEARCLRYAEASASAGERQLVQFNAQTLSYQDGRYYYSTDGSKSWRPYDPYGGRGTLNSLNVLESTGSAETLPESVRRAKANKKKKKKVAETRQAPAPAVAWTAQPLARAPAAPALPPPAPRRVVPPPPPPSRYSGFVLSGTPSANDESPASVPPPPSSGSGSGSGSGSAICQISVNAQWVSVPTATLSACGEAMIRRLGATPAKSGQAYWGGRYLFYSSQMLYESANGQDWRPLPR